MKGQLFDYESMNQHGVVGGNIWQIAGTTWIAYDAFTGNWIYNLTNVPSGFEVYTDKGEIVRYMLNYNETTTSGWLALWNNTQDNVGLHGGIGTGSDAYQWRPMGKTVDMSEAISWNVTTPNLSGSSSPEIVAVIPGDVILGRSSSFGRLGTADPYTLWAISDKPENRGQLLWKKDYSAPDGNLSRNFLLGNPVDAENRVFIMNDLETMELVGYSLDTGNLIWGPITGVENDFNYYGGGYGAGQLGYVAYDNVYVQGYGGELICYSSIDGNVQWKYSRNAGLEAPWGNYPIMIAAIADGKVYAFNNEHSPNQPLYKDYRLHCIDAFTGEELWTMMSWVGQIGGPGDSTSVLAEGFLAYYNYYDGQVYVIGKGPSATTATVSPKVASVGSAVLIEGTITDICAGAEKLVEDGKFNVVPVMSDESMGPWMEHLYMQKPKPTNATGVVVKLTVYDPNGDPHDVGTTTTDTTGKFALAWTPSIEGLHYLEATFGGTNSYWGSQESAYFTVGAAKSAQPTSTPTQTPSSSTTPTPSTPTATPTISPTVAPLPSEGFPTEALLIIGVAVIIIAVVAAAALLLRRRA